MVISHRGRKTGERENSIDAFEKAVKMGAGGIECDAKLLPNNDVAIYHEKISKINKDFLTLDKLFEYIKSKKIPFFVEVKSSSPILAKKIIEKIEENGLWEFVHIVGFSIFIKTALKFQNQYPKLRVLQFVNIPLYSFVKPPRKSYGVFLGWIDEWRGSQFLFKRLISQARLKKLVKFYQDNGFKVIAGVINNPEGIEYFKNAGVVDIVTDEIELANKILSKK